MYVLAALTSTIMFAGQSNSDTLELAPIIETSEWPKTYVPTILDF